MRWTRGLDANATMVAQSDFILTTHWPMHFSHFFIFQNLWSFCAESLEKVFDSILLLHSGHFNRFLWQTRTSVVALLFCLYTAFGLHSACYWCLIIVFYPHLLPKKWDSRAHNSDKEYLAWNKTILNGRNSDAQIFLYFRARRVTRRYAQQVGKQ